MVYVIVNEFLAVVVVFNNTELVPAQGRLVLVVLSFQFKNSTIIEVNLVELIVLVSWDYLFHFEDVQRIDQDLLLISECRE